VPVAVASFGEYEVIQKYMDRVAPGEFTRANICTPSCVGYSDGCSVPQGKVRAAALLRTRPCGSWRCEPAQGNRRVWSRHLVQRLQRLQRDGLYRLV
jgi:hypothetical protein